jgi:Leucine-rich repeat (LRR) protein
MNKLEKLPDEIGNLTNLVYLGLNRNRIEELPATIGNLENLEVLELWDNELYNIPDEISQLKKLKVLELRGILFSDEEGARIDSLLPNTKVMMSPTCNCKF